MPRTVLHRLDEAVGLAQGVQHQVRHVDVVHLAAGADVVHFTEDPTLQHDVDSLAVVQHVLVVPHLQPITVQRQWAIVDGVGDEERDHFFRVLIRANIVRAAADGYRQSIGDVVRVHHEIGTGLTRGIRRTRRQRVSLN